MFKLSKKGKQIMKLRFKEKYLELAACILTHEPFKQVLLEYLQTSTPPNKNRIVEIMKRCNL